MADIIVYCASHDGALKNSALEALGAGRAVADGLGGRLAAVIPGHGVGAAAEAAVGHGADLAIAAEHPTLLHYDVTTYLAGLEQVVGGLAPAAVLMAADNQGAELGPRLARRLGGSLVTEAIKFEVSGGKVACTKPVFGGKAQAIYTGARSPLVVTIRPRTQEPAAAGSRGGAVNKVSVELSDSLQVSKVLEHIREATGGLKLEDAKIIVAGGRGLGGPEPFQELKKLADILGGAVGASRAACDAGWVPASWQVGQTGTIVGPDLYIAIAISGASQHLAGIASAKHVIAINKDPEAPIFKRAALGIVSDYKVVLPTLTEEVRKMVAG